MRIGQLAERAKTRPSTLRYYEKRGLLQPPDRTSAGYRSYTEESVRRLQFIARARAAGFTLSQTAAILRIRDAGDTPCGHVRDLLGRRLSQLDEQIERLRLLRATIVQLRENASDERAQNCTPEDICSLL